MADTQQEITTESITRILEEEIMLGIKQPGHRLVEDELCRRFSVRRYMVRQALATLVGVGLAEKRRNVGAIVKYYSVREVTDLYAVRELLEEACLERIALPVAADAICHLEEIQTRHDRAVREKDLRAAVRENLTFHRAIYDLCDNPVLVDAVLEHGQRAQAVRSLTYTSPHQLEEKRSEHWLFIEALRHGDRDRLLTVARRHIRSALENYIAIHAPREDLVRNA